LRHPTHASPAVAPNHRAPGLRRDRPRDARKLVAVDAPEQVGVARRLGQVGRADRDRLAGDVVPALAAVSAFRDRDLVQRSLRWRCAVTRAREPAVAQRGQHLVIGERVPAAVLSARRVAVLPTSPT
jgi:hypothetical protein